jgi:hypothetical protein
LLLLLFVCLDVLFLLHFLTSSAFGCPVVQGYGLTETCGGCTVGDIDDLNGPFTSMNEETDFFFFFFGNDFW